MDQWKLKSFGYKPLLIALVLLTVKVNTSGALKYCTNGNGKTMCVENRLCKGGKVDVHGTLIIMERSGFEEPEFDDCASSGVVCCTVPEEQWLKTTSPTRTLITTTSTSTTTTATTTTTEQFLDYPDWNGQCGERYSGEGPPGSETKRWEFPWSAALFSITSILGRQVKVFLCGATLIDDQAVLTTAKCVQHRNRSGLVVHIGRWDANSDQEPFMQEIKVEKVVIHPKHYTSTAHIGNIALLFLTDSAQIGPASNRVCILDTQKIDTNSFCYVVGWSNNLVAGTPNHLLKIDAQYANRNECQTGIRNYGGVYNFNLPEEHLCADFTNTPAPCERVEGSGMVCALHENSEQFFLVGIAAYSHRQCNKYQVKDVFVSTKYYLKWIDKVMLRNNRYPNYYRPDLTHE